MAFMKKPAAPMGLSGEQYQREDAQMDAGPAIKQRKNDKMPFAKKDDGGTPAAVFGPKKGSRAV
jgi:hypothetical protein